MWFFSQGVNFQLNFEEIPHKKYNFFLFRSFERSELQAHVESNICRIKFEAYPIFCRHYSTELMIISRWSFVLAITKVSKIPTSK